jgi:hypothetical protein
MLIKVVVISETVDNTNLQNSFRKFKIQEMFINKNLIVSILEDEKFNLLNVQNKLPSGLSSDQKFTKITLNKGNFGEDISVIGDYTSIAKLIEAKNGK